MQFTRSCEICRQHSDEEDSLLLSCSSCQKYFHLDCIKNSLSSSLLGDTFFDLVCASCSSSQTAAVSRGRISWLIATLLALYNLHKNGSESKDGYFHWRNDICNFVNENWVVLFGSTVKKKKTWPGSVSSSLSGNAGALFESGYEKLREQGWWRLISLTPPHIQIKNALINLFGEPLHLWMLNSMGH